ncbi:hypothetical protein JNJ66_06365 [Candidatus Saccharibacteria bacterium]|nr:hypothetical protein [Candidatus Saccharibacteria bacterium]
MKSKRKKILYIVLVLLVAIAGSIATTMYISSQVRPQQGDTDADTTSNSPAPSAPINTSIIERVDNLKVLTSVPAPSDWKKHAADTAKIKIHYPNGWTTEERSPLTSNPNQSLRTISLSSDSSDDRCTIATRPISFEEATAAHEGGDDDDPGTIDPALDKAWRDIKQSDAFTLNGQRAIRYQETYRFSGSEQARTIVVYYIESKIPDRTFHFFCESMNPDTPALMDEMIHYISFT